MSAENEPDQQDAARVRFNAAEARQKAEFILSRCWGLLRAPKAEWEQIRDETTNSASILIGYVAPLAVLPPLCGLIGVYAFGIHVGDQVLRPAIGDALINAALTWIASVALVYLMGLLIDALAENFEGDRNDLAAQKVAAYAMTPAFFSGLFSLWPPAWWLSLIAIGYSVFLFYRGLPLLMKSPADRALSYASTVVIAGLVAFIVLFSISACVAGAGRL